MKNVNDDAFQAYGRVLTKEYDCTELITALNETEAPTDCVVYYPSIGEFEKLPIKKVLEESMYGELPIQIGYCNGTNQALNAVEYHRCSELGVAATDLILLIGKQQDITANYTYDTAQIEAFLVPAGTVYEMYATTLHFAPCGVDGKPFRNIVVLPKGTNTDLEVNGNIAREDKTLFAKNKWLIAHEDGGVEGAYIGLVGDNITI